MKKSMNQTLMAGVVCLALTTPVQAQAQAETPGPAPAAQAQDAPPDDALSDLLDDVTAAPESATTMQETGTAVEQAPDATQAEAQDSQSVAETIPVQVDEPVGMAVPAAVKRPPAQIEEIVVNARRTEESQQDVPIAITTMSADALRRESIGTVMDLAGRVPSLVMSTGGQQRSTESPTIRGQGATYGGGSGVLLYFAEAPLPADTTLNNVGGPGKFFDLQNMQVLKGSQGTLFGRNTTGGALILQPHKPENEFSASFMAEGSNYSGNGYEGVLNVPIISDTLLLRLGGKYFDREGFTKDVVNGTDYDDKHYWTVRAGLTWLPTDGVENYLFTYYTENHDNGVGTVIKQANPDSLNRLIMSNLGLQPLPLVPPQLQPGCLIWDAALARELSGCGELFAAEQRQRDNRHVALSAAPADNLWTGGVINTLSVDLSEELTLRNITSFSTLEHQYRWDTDGSRAKWTEFTEPEDQRQADFGVLTEELQLQGKYRDGRLVFTAGGYYERQKPRGPETTVISALYNGLNVVWKLERESYGPYAQTTYDLGDLSAALDGLKITAGARYSKDDIKGSSVFRQTMFGIPAAPVEESGGANDSAFTWTIGADYQFDSYLVYGKVSRGYKTGGFAITAVNPAYLTYKPEFVLNYEIGQKADFSIGDMPVRINTALYYTDYTDMQRNGVDVYSAPNSVSLAPRLGAAVFNAGKATIAGFEFEGTVIPFEGLTLSANYAYTKGKYEKYFLTSGSATPQLDCTGGTYPQGSVLDLSCMPFLYTPRHQYSVTAIYQVPVRENLGSVSASLTWAWVDRNYTSATTLPEAEPGAWLDAQGLLNASVNWEGVFNSNFYLQVYGTNLQDKEFVISNQNVWTTLGFQTVTYNEPRIIGARLGYRWGN